MSVSNRTTLLLKESLLLAAFVAGNYDQISQVVPHSNDQFTTLELTVYLGKLRVHSTFRGVDVCTARH